MTQPPEGLERWVSRFFDRLVQPLSNWVPEVELDLAGSFSPDLGTVRHLNAITVAEQRIARVEDVLAAVVVARGGWGPQGERDDAAVLATVEAFYRAWSAAFWVFALTHGVPATLSDALERQNVDFHPPRARLHTLPDGSRVVTHAQFTCYEGGERSAALAYEVHAHRLPSGEAFPIPDAPTATPPLPRPF